MIHVTDGYYITATSYGYNVVTLGGIDKKTKKQMVNTLAYYSTFCAAIFGVRQIVQRERFMGDRVIELKDALNIAEGIQAEFEELMKEVRERIGDV